MESTEAAPTEEAAPVFKASKERRGPLARFRHGAGFSTRQRRQLNGLRHLHRIFQVTLGLLVSRHLKVREACGEPVRWNYAHRLGGGYTFEGPRGRFVIVPTRDGAYCINTSAPEVVRAMDDTIALMLAQAEEALPTARPGREGNAVARGWFYLLHGMQETEYVGLYVKFMRAEVKAHPLGDLFDVWKD
ncbi:MAG TPA: hypothetical protein VNZ52_00470 [Candidatus Thermoplasmatota archaeon]|nr:hypothetical protein [Candidatus Thermoplasmatota archaeon]